MELIPRHYRARQKTGYQFARSRGESAHKQFWDALVGFWAPSLRYDGHTTLYDLSPYRNHGTFAGSMDASDWIQSPWGWALDFDGTDDRITLSGAQAAKLQCVTFLSVHSAFRVTGSVTSRTNIARAQGGGSVSGWGTGISDSVANRLKFYTATSAGSGHNMSGNTTLTSGVWYTAGWFYFQTSGASANKFTWLNGVEEANANWTGALGYTSCSSAIGRYEAAASQYWVGSIATLGVWNRFLSVKERLVLDADPLAPFRRRKVAIVKSIAAAVSMIPYVQQPAAPPTPFNWIAY